MTRSERRMSVSSTALSSMLFIPLASPHAKGSQITTQKHTSQQIQNGLKAHSALIKINMHAQTAKQPVSSIYARVILAPTFLASF
jgi:hypothetical protein